MKTHWRSSRHEGRLAEWSKAADCKSVTYGLRVVRIPHLPQDERNGTKDEGRLAERSKAADCKSVTYGLRVVRIPHLPQDERRVVSRHIHDLRRSLTSWTLVIHQDKISKDVRGTHAMVSRQPKAIGTRKSREADDGQAPKGEGTTGQDKRRSQSAL